MKIKFIVGFRGRETGERYFQPGDEWECEPNLAARLIADGHAEAVDCPAEVVEKPAKKGKSNEKNHP